MPKSMGWLILQEKDMALTLTKVLIKYSVQWGNVTSGFVTSTSFGPASECLCLKMFFVV